MKRQIHAYRGHGEIAVAGHNIKLGRGGIREIEFFVQTQQLIAGGRHPGTARPAHADDACIARRRPMGRPRPRGRDLEAGLSFSAQRRAPPADGGRRTDPYAAVRWRAADGASRRFLGFESVETLSPESLLVHLRNVQQQYSQLFEPASQPADRCPRVSGRQRRPGNTRSPFGAWVFATRSKCPRSCAAGSAASTSPCAAILRASQLRALVASADRAAGAHRESRTGACWLSIASWPACTLAVAAG